MPPADTSTTGLRERQKARRRSAIQSFALRLFREQGYEATTIEQIIAGVDVSESTLFRYFPTKESLVLTDEFDPIIIATFRDQPAEVGVLEALRIALHSLFAGLTSEQLAEQRERIEIILRAPGLRSALIDQFSETMTALSGAIAERTGRTADDFAIRTIAGAVIGVSLAVLAAMADDPDADYTALMDSALSQLEGGLAL